MCACRLPWSRHHPALALSRRLTEALSIFLVSSGEWGSGLGWGGQTLHPPLSFSAFLFFNKAGSKKKSSACGRERRRGQEPWEPLPSIRLSRAVFFQGRPLERVSEPALHTDASPLSHAQPAWGSWYWGRRHLFFFSLVTAGQLCSPPLPTLGNREGGGGVGGPCRPSMIQSKGAALRLGLLGHHPQSG